MTNNGQYSETLLTRFGNKKQQMKLIKQENFLKE
jgi:hypothetical protein